MSQFKFKRYESNAAERKRRNAREIKERKNLISAEHVPEYRERREEYQFQFPQSLIPWLGSTFGAFPEFV